VDLAVTVLLIGLFKNSVMMLMLLLPAQENGPFHNDNDSGGNDVYFILATGNNRIEQS